MHIFGISNTTEERTIKVKGNNGFIEERFFQKDQTLKKIIISKKIKKINEYAFANCENLEEVIFEKESKIEKIENCTLIGCDNLKKINIPNSVEMICAFAFAHCINLENIEIPNSVFLIGHGAFDGCKKLKRLFIPHSVNRIKDYSFCNCEELTDLTIEEGVEVIEERAFSNAKSLKKIIIPSSVRVLAEGAFDNCESLEEVVLNDGLKVFDLTTFSNCKNLKKVIIPSSVDYIEHVESGLTFNDRSFDLNDWNSVENIEFYSRKINERFINDIKYYNDELFSEIVAGLFTKYSYMKNDFDKNFDGLNKNELKRYKGLIVDAAIEELCSKYPYIKKELLNLVNIKFKIREYKDKNVDFEEEYNNFIQYCNNYVFSNNDRQMNNLSVSETLVNNNHSNVNSALSVSSKPVDEFVPWYWMNQSSVYEDYANISANISGAISKLIDDEESLLLKQLGITKNESGYWKDGDIIPELKVMDEMKALKRTNNLRKFS